ncbi:uncharacterized protein LOC119614132 [Lucilia sericata]|uniref:uncharacterized protein LOC119614132 n=1 Tax=Lucilia sericata TaxID=13632 RepID=UPI0018A841C3|nr:uncharacterized protein LOC119614132 [Lucilia sericata]XP_037826164.1 uncharacterized protein LOC119614132 [Lucilia sericata]
MKKVKPEWSKSYTIRPRHQLQSHILSNEKNRFKASYENEVCPAPMNLLIGWEYARLWLKERDEFVKARFNSIKPKRIKNNYQTWLEKRKPRINESCRAQGVKKLMLKEDKNKTILKKN